MADSSFLAILGLIWGFQSLLCAAEQDTVIKKVFGGQRVNLTCHLNSTDSVTWLYSNTGFLVIATCGENQGSQCKKENPHLFSSYNVQATRQNDTSILSLTVPAERDEREEFHCRLGNVNMRSYTLILIDPSDTVPYCDVTLPNRNENGVDGVTLSCGVYSGLEIDLTFEGIGLSNTPESPRSSQGIRTKTLQFDGFNNVYNASCNVYFTDILINRSCIYPNIIKTQYNVKGNDVIVECDDESDVDWYLFDSDRRAEDKENRLWTREGGRTLLIRNISKQDKGKVVVCKTKGDNSSNGIIGFSVISKISGDTNKSNSEDAKFALGAHNPFLVLTLLFLSLWVITTAVGGVCLWSRSKWNKSFTSASGNTSGPNSRLNQSNDEPNLIRGDGESETHFVNVGTGARGNSHTLNTNNSAHNPDFQLGEDGTDGSNPNRQSNNESHLYFTLEQSSQSKGPLRKASTSRRERHGDTNKTSLSQDQSTHWQGYEPVDNVTAASSYDVGEYAEVGDHIIGRNHLDESFRPSIREVPGRLEVKEDNISRLYSKVNK